MISSSDRLIVMYYAGGAGGKFISNILGLAENACPQHPKFLEMSAKQKYEEILKLYTTANLINWADYEFGDIEFFGFDTPIENDIVLKLQKNNHYFFSTAHSLEKLIAILDLWPNAKVIQLQNSHKFREQCQTLKKYNSCKFATFHEVIPVPSTYTINVSKSYYDKNIFLETIQEIYKILDLKNYNQQYISDIYMSYAKLHHLV